MVTTVLAGAADVDELVEFVAASTRERRVVVLSGAGLSTESGIPDYRGPTGLARRATPMQYRDFVSDPAARQRYWARSHVGWSVFGGADPNAGHRAVAALQRLGVVGGVVTQNVDGLHQAAGATDVVDLHGRLDVVVCLDCRARTDRREHDERLRAANPLFVEHARTALTVDNPDGDAELAADAVGGFRVVDCADCGGVLKPDVVFFGENVPRERVLTCTGLVESSSGVLVLGSSLTVMSGLRFVRMAARAGLPVAIVNQGATRGDPLAGLRVDAPLGPTLTAVVDRLSRPR